MCRVFAGLVELWLVEGTMDARPPDNPNAVNNPQHERDSEGGGGMRDQPGGGADIPW